MDWTTLAEWIGALGVGVIKGFLWLLATLLFSCAIGLGVSIGWKAGKE